jgi:peptidyl-prolyl cis-trans isomerase SurA
MSEEDYPEERMYKMGRFGVFVLVCVLLFSGFARATVLLDRVAAVVNQDVITWSELYKSMEADASPTVKAMKEDEKRKVFRENEAAFLETLIDVKLQMQEAKNLGISVSDGEIQESIDNIKKKYSMADDAFKESLKREGFTYEEYKKRLREQIIIGKLVNAQIKSKIVVKDEDIRKYIAENKDALENTESYKISQIVLKKPKDVDRSRIEEKAGELLKKIEQGESFSNIAKQYSEDSSASSGGDLGLLKKSQLSKTFTDVISGMKPGDVSKPFWTERGLHIIKLESMSAAKSKDEIYDEAGNILRNKLFTTKYNAWIKSLRQKAFIEVRL